MGFYGPGAGPPAPSIPITMIPSITVMQVEVWDYKSSAIYLPGVRDPSIFIRTSMLTISLYFPTSMNRNETEHT